MLKGEKKNYDFSECMAALQKPNPSQTPRSKLNSISSQQMLDVSRRSMTPSRMQERISNSPLKIPLNRAVQKAVRDRTPTNRSPSRVTNRSSRREENSIVSIGRKYLHDDEPSIDRQSKAHSETLTFLKKYFDLNSSAIRTEVFIHRILQEYEGLWGTDNVEQIIEDFTYKIHEIFDSELIDTRDLMQRTKNDGMIGLILQIFKEIKN